MIAERIRERSDSLPDEGKPGIASHFGTWNRFKVETRDLFVQRTRIGCWLAFTLIPVGSLLDYVSYPGLFYEILVARLLAAASIVGIYLALRTNVGRRRVLWLSAGWAIIPALTISWMIYLTDGGASPFYAGLNLVILGTCVLVPYTLSQAAVYCCVVYAIYVLACVFHGGLAATTAPFVSNSIFIVMTSVICVTFCLFNDRLRRRDFQLRGEIQRRNRDLQALDAMKTRFFANVSHELRTPLTLILGHVQQGLSRPLEEAESRSLRTIERNALRLTRLIDDLLDLVRSDGPSPNRLVLTTFDANDELRAICDGASSFAREREIELCFEASTGAAPVLADVDQFERAVLNLIANAIKFTPANGRVAVALRLDESDVRIDVRDTGIGIAESDIPRLTERFVQVDTSETRRYPGLGLGLAIVKGIMDSHGGSVEIRSRIGEGSCVSLLFPRAAAVDTPSDRSLSGRSLAPLLPVSKVRNADSATSNVPSSDEASETGCVLIADDEPELREFLAGSLGRSFKTTTVSDGEAALTSAERDRPEVAVLDMMMPGLSGLEVARRLRAADADRDCKIVMLTARIDEALKLEALAAGVDDFLFKPFSMAEVEARVGNLARSSRLQRALREANDELRETLRKLGETQAQLVQSEKMNALGGLAAGILHEFKNPLNHALMGLAFARQTYARLPSDVAESLSETFDDVEAALRRIDDIATDMRTFAHPEAASAIQTFPLAEAVNAAARFVAAELGVASLTIDVDPGVYVECPRNHLVQVLVNLLSNAAAAVAESATRRTPQVVVSAETLASVVQIVVRDNGIGIPSENLGRVFEPFYTTKPVGSGTGLGLTVSHSLTAEWGSKLTVSSEPDIGTEFRFAVPLAGHAVHLEVEA